ncbi:hypothetical protein [Streptomyces sp. NBC_00151]|uniref:hypothetical protein n=1 Tax=Streptomyces sp. NBC_00151 TaxID=2975669 RepID=UPI002DDB4931|nr:hypothetical protein [Streptomyces sp. NBC_00151]WRZ43631.1 hypothetical protein OG915_39685 [Streptomyces sp. NBC_00151]
MARVGGSHKIRIADLTLSAPAWADPTPGNASAGTTLPTGSSPSPTATPGTTPGASPSNTTTDPATPSAPSPTGVNGSATESPSGTPTSTTPPTSGAPDDGSDSLSELEKY